MERMSQQTSLIAYHTKVLPCLAASQAVIYDLLRDATAKGFDMSNMEIAAALDWSINRVTPRVKELREDGRVVLCGRRRCGVTGNWVMTWKVRTHE